MGFSCYILIDFIQDKSKDLIGLTSGFIEKLNRNEKTYILEHLLFIEKEDGFNAYEVTPSIKQNKDKYNNICGDEFCRYLDDLDERFETKKKLDSLEINDKDKSFAFYMRDFIDKKKEKKDINI